MFIQSLTYTNDKLVLNSNKTQTYPTEQVDTKFSNALTYTNNQLASNYIITQTYNQTETHALLSTLNTSNEPICNTVSPLLKVQDNETGKIELNLADSFSTTVNNKAETIYVRVNLALKADLTATQSSLKFKANLASPTFTGTVSGITKSMVGLTNVDNTPDASKTLSLATQSALKFKANALDTYTNAQVDSITSKAANNTSSSFLSPVVYAMGLFFGLSNNVATNTFDINKHVTDSMKTLGVLLANRDIWAHMIRANGAE
jgi:hypothetical protein